jgi:hypothetical protein
MFEFYLQFAFLILDFSSPSDAVSKGCHVLGFSNVLVPACAVLPRLNKELLPLDSWKDSFSLKKITLCATRCHVSS